MNNKLYIAAAGAGKTTFLIKRAIDLLKMIVMQNVSLS